MGVLIGFLIHLQANEDKTLKDELIPRVILPINFITEVDMYQVIFATFIPANYN